MSPLVDQFGRTYMQPQQTPGQAPAWRRLAREIVETALLTLLIFGVIRVSFQTFKVVGPSMQPGLHELSPGQYEYLAVATFLNWFKAPQRGNVVVFYHHHMPHIPGDAASLANGCTLDPDTNGAYMTCEFVKRVIGVPGDTVTITTTGVAVNGVTLHEPYVAIPPGEPQNPDGIGKHTLGTGQYWMMGDNRLNSDDSRVFGAVPRSDIIGEAFMVFWPMSAAHWLPNYTAVFAGVKG